MKIKNWTKSLSFTWDIVDFNYRKKEYTLQNRTTYEIRNITRERLLELIAEQTKHEIPVKSHGKLKIS